MSPGVYFCCCPMKFEELNISNVFSIRLKVIYIYYMPPFITSILWHDGRQYIISETQLICALLAFHKNTTIMTISSYFNDVGWWKHIHQETSENCLSLFQIGPMVFFMNWNGLISLLKDTIIKNYQLRMHLNLWTT